LIDALVGTAVASLAGLVRVIVGAVVSGPDPVLKVQVNALANGFPARSVAPVVIVAIKCVLAARARVGVNVAVVPMVE
jgi:hypothetical protein